MLHARVNVAERTCPIATRTYYGEGKPAAVTLKLGVALNHMRSH